MKITRWAMMSLTLGLIIAPGCDPNPGGPAFPETPAAPGGSAPATPETTTKTSKTNGAEKLKTNLDVQ